VNHNAEIVREGIASAPPVVVAALTMAGVGLQDWVLIATLGWIGLQITYFLYQRWKEWS